MKWLPPPGPQRRRQLTLLAIMLVLLAVLGWRYLDSGPAAPAPVGAKAASSLPTPINAANLPQPVSLAKLEPVPDVPENGRNLFRFGERPVPPPAPRPYTPPPAPPPLPPPAPVGPPRIQLLLIGILTGGDGRPAVHLKDPKTGAVFMGGEGQIVEGQYKIVKIGVTSVIVSYPDGSGQLGIGLR